MNVLPMDIYAQPGTDDMSFKIFSPKCLAKSWCLQMLVFFEKNVDHNIGF
jgi:hypothetical protein